MAIFDEAFWSRLTGGAGTAAGGLRAAFRWSAQAALTAALTVGLLLAVQHGCPAPGPVPPTPPGPGPGPTPPVPPGPVAGMRVLIVYESADLPKYPPAQLNVLYATSVRAYLDAHTRAQPGGKAHDWGIFDKDVDLSGYSKALQEMMARPHPTLPWVVVAGDGGVAHEGALPGNVDDTLALLKKYGGN